MAAKWATKSRIYALLSSFAAVAFFFAPIDAVASVSQETIGLFGLLLAGALPAMILTATILRAGAFSPRRIGEYTEALDKQLTFWFALFVWALVACVMTTLSKALWDDTTPTKFQMMAVHFRSLAIPVMSVELSRFANAGGAFAGTEVILRLVPMLHGLRSLLKLNSQIAKEEAANRVLETKSATTEQIEKMVAPSGHSSVVELPNDER